MMKSSEKKAGDMHISAKRIALFVILCAASALLPDFAMATTYNSPMGGVICEIVGFFIYGNLGRGLATAAVLIVGVGATLGKVSWGLAITVACGISVIFYAPLIVTRLTGAGGC
jgi:type IV secretory pathway VirB2 component (pilin)